MERVKLFLFYQLMAFQSLRRPSDGQVMTDIAHEGRAERGRKATMAAVFGLGQAAKRPASKCWCHICNTPEPVFGRRMILCPVCGNKRCPHANSHALDCTGSNETGQPGSAYP